MSQRDDSLIVALDAGSAFTRVLAADVYEGVLRYRGHGMVLSAGMRKGLIAELAPAAKAIRAASQQAEKVAQVNISRCLVGVGGPHTQGRNYTGGIVLGTRMREITKEDARFAAEQARAIERPPDRDILHLLPRQFILDSQPGIFDPIGMVGLCLEVDMHIVTCSGSAMQSTITCANRAGIEVSQPVLESVAAAEAILSADEREFGVCLLNIGAHSTDLIVFFEGAVVHTGSVPIGGSHFTNDLAVGLSMPVAQAEELKKEFGHVVVTAVPLTDEIEIANPQPQILPLRALAEILQPRARELLYFVKENLRQSDLAESLGFADVIEVLGSGCVLTGGGALLPGMLEVTENQLRVPARLGLPVRLSNMPNELVHPGFSTAIGMLLYAHYTRTERAEKIKGLRARISAKFTGSF